MKARPLAFLGFALVLGCQTEITFKNDIPNATIENLRWLTDDGKVYAPESDDALEPGQSSEPVSIVEPDEGETGRIHLELVVEGRKVALVTDRSFTAETGSSSTFSLNPSTTARNTLTSAP